MKDDVLNKAAKREGFGLEVRTQEIFKKHCFNVKQNIPDDVNSLIDVFASPSDINQGSIFITECKGTSTEHILLLYGNTGDILFEKKTHRGILCRPMPRLQCDSTGVVKTYRPDLGCQKGVLLVDQNNQFAAAVRHAYTGDFRKSASEADKKLPRNDNKNNLFKGISQLLNHLNNSKKLLSNAWNDGIAPLTIIPLIVTNAKILIKENNNKDVTEVKWAIHSTAAVITSQKKLTDYVFIVTADELDEFIRVFG